MILSSAVSNTSLFYALEQMSTFNTNGFTKLLRVGESKFSSWRCAITLHFFLPHSTVILKGKGDQHLMLKFYLIQKM